MIQLAISETSLRAVQRDTSPAVYLDHWAVRTLSEDVTLRARLVAAIKRRNGSLALSWVNVAEFSKLTDAAQVRAAESLFEEALPNVHFLEVDPFKVIDREDALLAGGSPLPPHLDPDTLKVCILSLRPESGQPFTVRGLFRAVQGTPLPGLTKFADAFIGRVARLRDELDDDPSFRASLKAARPRGQAPQATRVILWEIARALTLDGKKVTPNDAMDMYHAVVPAAYCEYVLLDKHWRGQIDSCSKRCADAQLTVRIAKVYSKGNDGVEQFLTDLEEIA